MCPYGVFHCKDGDIVMAASGKRIWDSLCDLMGRPEWKEDPEYQEVGDRARHQKVLIPLFNEWLTNSFSGQDEALAALDAAGIHAVRFRMSIRHGPTKISVKMAGFQKHLLCRI